MGSQNQPGERSEPDFFARRRRFFWAVTRSIQPKKQGKSAFHTPGLSHRKSERPTLLVFDRVSCRDWSSFSPQAALLGWRSNPQHDVHSASRGLDPRCTCGCYTLGGYELARAHADKCGFLRCRRRRWSTFAVTQYVFRARAHSKPTGAGWLNRHFVPLLECKQRQRRLAWAGIGVCVQPIAGGRAAFSRRSTHTAFAAGATTSCIGRHDSRRRLRRRRAFALPARRL